MTIAVKCVRITSCAVFSGLCNTVSKYEGVQPSFHQPSWPWFVCDVAERSESIRLCLICHQLICRVK